MIVRKRQDRLGYGVITGPAGRIELDTATCAHCQRVWCVRSSDPAQPTSLGGACRVCGGLVCDACAGAGVCQPILQQIETYERRMRLRRQLEACEA